MNEDSMYGAILPKNDGDRMGAEKLDKVLAIMAKYKLDDLEMAKALIDPALEKKFSNILERYNTAVDAELAFQLLDQTDESIANILGTEATVQVSNDDSSANTSSAGGGRSSSLPEDGNSQKSLKFRDFPCEESFYIIKGWICIECGYIHPEEISECDACGGKRVDPPRKTS